MSKSGTEVDHQKGTRLEEQESVEHRENAYKSFLRGTKGIVASLRYSFAWIWTWLDEQHPVIQGLALLPIMSGFQIGGALLAEIFNSIFWESSVIIQRDVIIQNFPFPVSLTFYFLISFIVLSHLLSSVRVRKLEDRIAELEEGS